MKPVMYLFSNPSTPMSTGKRAAQCAHAAVEAFRLEPCTSTDANIKRMWDCGGHYTKIVLQTDDLALTERYLNERGFQTALIIDEGHTEFESDLTPTALGVEVVDKDSDHVQATLSAFKLYEDPKPPALVLTTQTPLTRPQREDLYKLIQADRIEDARQLLKDYEAENKPTWRFIRWVGRR